jgi:hypothetical protein
MRAWAASVEEVFREASARWTLLAYFALSTLFIMIFALAVNLDIVDGALAGAKLFGKELDLGGGKIDMDQLVLGFETGFSGVLFIIMHAKGEYSRYDHLAFSSSRVINGQPVRAGQEIARVGMTGYTYTPHLHFQVFVFTGSNIWEDYQTLKVHFP